MPFSEPIKARKISREQMAWKEPKQKQRNNARSIGSTIATLSAAVTSNTINAGKYTSFRVSFATGDYSGQSVALNPFSFTEQAGALLRFDLVTKYAFNAELSGLLVAFRVNGADVAIADFAKKGSAEFATLSAIVRLNAGDVMTIEARAKNTATSSQFLELLSAVLTVSYA